MLAERGVNAPAGHFYAIECSRHLGLGDTGGVRVGLAPYTSADDIDRLVTALTEILWRERNPHGTARPRPRPGHRLLVRHRPRGGRGLLVRPATPSTPPPAGPRRSPTSSAPAPASLALDVTAEESMAAAVRASRPSTAAVGTLVNNAGYGEYGTIEEADLDKVRAMFETNVFGLARHHPARPARHARGPRRPRSSTSGRWAGGSPSPSVATTTRRSTPWRPSPTPCATRSAASASTSVLIEPGLIRTGFEETVLASDAMRRTQADSPYAALLRVGADATPPAATPTR